MTDGTEWTVVAMLSEIAEGDVVAVKIGEQAIAVYNVDGEIHATDNTCTHAFAILSDGWLDGYVIECPLHAGRFDIRTGKALGPPVDQDIGTYEVRVIGGEVHVGRKRANHLDQKS